MTVCLHASPCEMPKTTQQPKNATPFAVWLRQARTSMELTQDELAESSGIDQGLISKYERGVLMPPRANVVESLAAVLSAPGTDDQNRNRLLNRGLLAAGFAPIDTDGDMEIEQKIVYEPIMDELRSASYDGSGLAPDDVDEIAEYIRMKAKRRAQKRGAD